MAARPAVVPRPREEHGSLPPGEHPEKPHPPPPPVGLAHAEIPFATPVVAADLPPLELSEFVFSETSPHFQVEDEVDPIDAEAEEAAMLYANGQDSAVRALLVNSTSRHRSGAGERLWLMLFDFLRLTGEKTAFDGLGIEYAQSFEKSPPGWRGAEVATPVAAKAAGIVLFKGELSAANDGGFDTVRSALERTPHLRVDLSKVRQVDAGGCERLLALLLQARRSRREIELLGRDHVATLLDKRIAAKRAEDRDCWLLRLEFFQLRGQLEAFEEMAINYAVTFEISPPSWEAKRVLAAEPAPLLVAADELLSESYVLKGDIRSSRFPDLVSYAAANDPLLIDCMDVTRMDFLSAGALLNMLTTVNRTGRKIVFVHTNYLLAELFRVVGLKAVAEVVLARN